MFDIPVELVSDRYEIMRFGGGGEPAQVTCGVVEPDHESARRLVAQLPDVLHVDAWDDGDASWLHSTLRLVTREAAAKKPGGEMVMTRLADVLVVQTVRAWLDSAPEARQGWLAALRDEHVGRALIAIHRSPGTDWGVDSLAREVGHVAVGVLRAVHGPGRRLGHAVRHGLAAAAGARAPEPQHGTAVGRRAPVRLPVGGRVLARVQAGVRRAAPGSVRQAVEVDWRTRRGPAA